MAQDFLHYYLNEADRVYKYRIKFATDELTDAQMDRLEKALEKYDLEKCSQPTFTPIQAHPLDFPKIQNTRVGILDVEVRYPASQGMLRNIAAESTGVHIGAIAVYGENDPRDAETLARERIDNPEPVESVLASELEPGEEGAQELVGQSRTQALLDELKRVREERENRVVTNTLIPDQVTDDAGIVNEDTQL